ncbi:Protein TESPA1 [Oryzias melastigma]|uniref:Protein TESPA1 n=1 Tax=Oryzias melastigma TaxID=30732 RepID=A0A834L263_ORYME|nr:Protein TESPA1 [Oryzias melastigma]
MERASSTDRRRAWINSRQRPTLEEPQGLLSTSMIEDNVFPDSESKEKIESWLRGCRSDDNARVSFEAELALNFPDDLSLGADASVVGVASVTHRAGTRRRRLGLPPLKHGLSMTSSCYSTSTCKTISSVSDILQLYEEDAEEVLCALGFGGEEEQITAPASICGFSWTPKSSGYEKRTTDSVSPVVFRQVEVLTATANAFYSLYSYVSRTPLQKLDTPVFTFPSPVRKMERFQPSTSSGPRSPVERLKDTVHRMCLYTGSPRGFESTSPQPLHRKRSSVPDIVELIMRTKTGTAKKLDLEEHNTNKQIVDDRLTSWDGEKEPMQEVDANMSQHDTKVCETEDNIRKEHVELGSTNSGPIFFATLSSSEETLTDPEQQFPVSWSELDSCPTQSDAGAAEPLPTCDFCGQIPHNTNCSLPGEHIDAPSPESNKSCVLAQDCSPQTTNVTELSGGCGRCCITVTGWDGENESPRSTKTARFQYALPVVPTVTSKESINQGDTKYLKPMTHPSMGDFSSTRQQVNSFELEEVHSAGEEDFGQSELSKTSQLSRCPNKGEVVRGDSVQSDSSGYADEDLGPSAEKLSS